MNYRAVMVMGQAEVTRDPVAKAAQLQRLVDLHWPGRWDALRPITAQELKATSVLSMPLDEASAKVSTGMAADVAGDETWPVWSGVIPVMQVTGVPLADPAGTGGKDGATALGSACKSNKKKPAGCFNRRAFLFGRSVKPQRKNRK